MRWDTRAERRMCGRASAQGAQGRPLHRPPCGLLQAAGGWESTQGTSHSHSSLLKAAHFSEILLLYP